MARVSSRQGKYGKEFSVNLSRKESADAELSQDGEYEFVKAKHGLWVLVEKAGQAVAGGSAVAAGAAGAAKAAGAVKASPGKAASDPDESRILSLLRRKTLAEMVEGKFEKRLNDRELKRFNELLLEGRIERFRLSPKYKKSVYRIAPGREQKQAVGRGGTSAPVGSAGRGSQEGASLEKDGYIVVRGEHLARRLSEELAEQIRAGEIRGIKSFDGNFYIAKSELYSKYAEQVLSYIKQKGTAGVADIAGRFKFDSVLAKIICEFLREDNEIAEKRRGLYRYIG